MTLRNSILDELHDAPASVQELRDKFPRHPSREIQRELAALQSDGLVETMWRQSGRWRLVYQLKRTVRKGPPLRVAA